MSLFSAATITRFANEGENDFCNDRNCIVNRVALSIVNGTSEYTLSDTVQNIRRVTWKGKKLDPLPHRELRDYFQNAGQIGQPFWYVFNNIGTNKIKFFPTPNETIASISSNLYGSEIANRVIVDYYIVPDNVTYTLPSYFRRRLLKVYVLKACFAIEGQGQNIKSARYFDKKYNTLKILYSELLDDIHNRPRKIIVGGMGSTQYFPGRPVWPIDRFGISVDRGE